MFKDFFKSVVIRWSANVHDCVAVAGFLKFISLELELPALAVCQERVRGVPRKPNPQLATRTDAGACYQFSGTGNVKFTDEMDFSSRAHFKLSFKTIADSGVIYYAEGAYHPERVYDFEGVFMRDGFLHYFLFNPKEYSIGSSFGFHGKSKKRVNDGKWHTAEFYRNIQVETIRLDGRKQVVHQTGLKLDGELQAYDDRWRDDVIIGQPIILGEDPHLQDRSSKSIGSFKGKIKDFQDLVHNHHFDAEDGTLSGVSHCITGPDLA